MSGFEIAGVVLGALPLIIGAMEFFEDTHKAPRTWWKIRRAHRRDLGRLQDCELSFQQNMKELLVPLRMNKTITHGEYETLLAHPENTRWKRPDLQEALAERLANCRDRYLEILQEISTLLTKLAVATMVNDDLFQRRVGQRKDQTNADAYTQGFGGMVQFANEALTFQLKRVSYSVTTFRRDALNDEMEQLNATLLRFLRSNDRIASLAGTADITNTSGIKRKYRTLLLLSPHTERILRLLKDAWRCDCAALHCAHVWLKDRSTSEEVQLEMLIEFATAHEQIPAGAWTRRQLAIKLTRRASKKRTVRFQGLPDSQKSLSWREVPVNAAEPPAKTPRLDITSALQQFKAMTLLAGTHIPAQGVNPEPNRIQEFGLCAAATSCSAKVSGSLGMLNSDLHGRRLDALASDHLYEVLHLAGEARSNAHGRGSESLGDVLEKTSSKTLLRVERLAMASMIASSFLQLFSTPWFPGPCTANDILLSTDSCWSVSGLQQRQPFIVARFSDEPATRTTLDDTAFMELGIVLLELCFNRRLHDHSRWREHASNAPLSVQCLIRSAVASEWAMDVQYATAVDWCLHKASLKNADWRIEFARHVVQPLQRCHEAGFRATQAV